MSRPVLIALAGFVVIAIAIGMSLWTLNRDRQAPPPTVTESPQPPAGQPPAAAGNAAPSFDIVRINPQGETVMAGRAQPKAEVQILDGGRELGRVTADARGEWVFVPEQPLPPGNRELSLKATNADGSTGESQAPVMLVVPDRTKSKDASLAVKVNPDGSLEILQGPAAQGDAGRLSIAGVGYDANGRLAVTGKADPKAWVRIYADDKPIGRVQADDQGQWRLTARTEMKPGDHALRADQLTANGKVAARAQITFQPTGGQPAEGKLIVERGNSLWRIARRAYGSGLSYTVIFEANKEQIRDPDRIYPGQVFEIPSKAP